LNFFSRPLRAQRRSDFGLKQLFHHEDHSAVKPQPKHLGIGELTTKGAKNAKEEIGLSRAKHVLSNVEGTPSSFDFLCVLCTAIRDNLRGVREFLDAPNPRGRVSNPPLQIPILFLRPLRSLRLIFRSESSSVAAALR
jgi:hypothetical protein